MEHIGSAKPEIRSRKKDPYLHTANHLLADELMRLFNDTKHFGLYLGLTKKYPPDYLRKIAYEIKEMKNIQTPGKLFSYLVKKKAQPENNS